MRSETERKRSCGVPIEAEPPLTDERDGGGIGGRESLEDFYEEFVAKQGVHLWVGLALKLLLII